LTLKWVVRSGGGVFIFFFFKKELGGVLYTKEEKMCPGSHDRENELDCSIRVYILLKIVGCFGADDLFMLVNTGEVV